MLSSTSDHHINAMDMNANYGDGANPVILKSEFLMSLCDLLVEDRHLGAKEKSIIDRCTTATYRYYKQGNYCGEPPTLQDFYEQLLKQKEPEAHDLAVDIEMYAIGNMNTFAHYPEILALFGRRDLVQEKRAMAGQELSSASRRSDLLRLGG